MGFKRALLGFMSNYAVSGSGWDSKLWGWAVEFIEPWVFSIQGKLYGHGVNVWGRGLKASQLLVFSMKVESYASLSS